MSSRGKAPVVPCDLCGKPIAARASHYVVEYDSGGWDVWCYPCAATARAHRKLAPKCKDADRCDIWFRHAGYQLVMCETRSAYSRYVGEREDEATLARDSTASVRPEVPVGVSEVAGDATEGSR